MIKSPLGDLGAKEAKRLTAEEAKGAEEKKIKCLKPVPSRVPLRETNPD
jgi:hypothetical protein